MNTSENNQSVAWLRPRPAPPENLPRDAARSLPRTGKQPCGCGCGKKGAAGAVSFVLGIGTGRCGTTSLTRLLKAQPGVHATHEARPLLPWNPRKSKENVVDRVCRLVAAAPPRARIVADVALYYLPYVATILRHWPATRVICLRRDRAEVIESFARKVREHWGDTVNHWTVHQ